MSTYQAPDELVALVTALVDQQIDDAQLERLGELLAADADARAYYLQQVEIHARLRVELGGFESEPIVDATGGEASPLLRPTPAPREDRSRLGISLAVVVALLLLTIPAYLLTRPVGNPRPPIATLAEVFDAEWTGNSVGLEAGMRLSPGRMKLLSGAAEIRFDSGASVALEGPAEFELIDPTIGRLHSGRLVALVTEPAKRFLIETQRARVVDLGTQFGVEVAAGETTVQVFQGRVETQVKDSTNTEWHTVREGEAIKIGPQSVTPAAEPFAPGQFVRELPPPGKNYEPNILPRHDRIAIRPAPGAVKIDGDLSDWDRSGAFFTACQEPYAANYNLTGYMMYDRQNVYIAAVVADPHPLLNSMDPATESTKIWMGGSLQVRLSADRKHPWPLAARAPELAEKAKQEATPEDLSEQLAHLTLWYARADQRARLHVAYGMDLHGERIDPAGFAGAFQAGEAGHSYTLEYAIPWALLHAAADPPRQGDVLGASWMLHWSDPTGREKRAYLVDIFNPDYSADLIRTFKQSATWGRAEYQ